MAPTVESLIEGFPNPIIQPIAGEPTYETIMAVARQLKANATSVQTKLGSEALGHLASMILAHYQSSHLEPVQRKSKQPFASMN
jgi:hypothetical protein